MNRLNFGLARYDSLKDFRPMSNQARRGDNSHQILVIEDAPKTRRMLELQLTHAGYAVQSVANGRQAIEIVRRHGLPRLVILDNSLPDMQAAAVADAIATLGLVPMIELISPCMPSTNAAMLAEAEKGQAKTSSGKANFEDAVPWAEEYLVKPFVFSELLALIERVLNRAEVPPMSDQELLLDNNLKINFAQHYLIVNGQQVTLTPTENRLLHLLYTNRGRVVSPGYLMTKAWDARQKGTLGSLWVHIRRLRNKLERDPEDPHYLITVRGQGYYLQFEHTPTQLH
jgi:DNA-binding response OmpR family regulator